MTAEPAAGRLLAAAGGPSAAASWRAAPYRDDAPGAVLDPQPWARSWAAYLRAVNDPDDSSARRIIKNAMSERVPSEGGFLVPEQLRSQVMAYMTPAVIRPRAMVLPMGSLRLGIPVLDNPAQSQALGGLTFAFLEEGVPVPQSNPAFARAVLEARKLAALLLAPDELADDAAGAMGDFLARVVAMGLAWVEDDYFIGASGTGAGCPQSILNAPAALPVARASAGQGPVLTDIAKMAKALHPAAKQAGYTAGITGVAWLLSASAFDSLLELYLNAGGTSAPATVTPSAPPDWLQLGDGNQVGPSMLGLPALVTDHQPPAGTAGDVMLADLRQYVIGDRLIMTVERSAAGPGFPAGASYFRIKSRVDGRYWVQSPVTTEAGQQVSPVVVLQ